MVFAKEAFVVSWLNKFLAGLTPPQQNICKQTCQLLGTRPDSQPILLQVFLRAVFLKKHLIGFVLFFGAWYLQPRFEAKIHIPEEKNRINLRQSETSI